MAVILSRRDLNEVAVDATGRTWLVATPTRWLKYAWQRDMEVQLAAAARAMAVEALPFRTAPELYSLAREAIEALVDDLDQRSRLLAIVDAMADADADAEPAPEVRASWAELEAELIAGWPLYRHAVEDRSVRIEVAASTAVRRFVVGQAGEPPLPKTRDGLTDAGYAAVPVEDRFELYRRILQLMAPTETERGN